MQDAFLFVHLSIIICILLVCSLLFFEVCPIQPALVADKHFGFRPWHGRCNVKKDRLSFYKGITLKVRKKLFIFSFFLLFTFGFLHVKTNIIFKANLQDSNFLFFFFWKGELPSISQKLYKRIERNTKANYKYNSLAFYLK